MKKFYALLLGKSFEEIKRLNLYSRASFYRYKQRFKKIGVTDQNLMPMQLCRVSTDFKEYHSMAELSRFIRHQ